MLERKTERFGWLNNNFKMTHNNRFCASIANEIAILHLLNAMYPMIFDNNQSAVILQYNCGEVLDVPGHNIDKDYFKIFTLISFAQSIILMSLLQSLLNIWEWAFIRVSHLCWMFFQSKSQQKQSTFRYNILRNIEMVCVQRLELKIIVNVHCIQTLTYLFISYW